MTDQPQSTVALYSTAGAQVLAKGATKAAVDDACALVNGVAVSAQGASVGSVTVALPPSLVIPLKS